MRFASCSRKKKKNLTHPALCLSIGHRHHRTSELAFSRLSISLSLPDPHLTHPSSTSVPSPRHRLTSYCTYVLFALFDNPSSRHAPNFRSSRNWKCMAGVAVPNLLRRISSKTTLNPHSALKAVEFPQHLLSQNTSTKHEKQNQKLFLIRYISGSASSPSLSIWRRKKEMGKEGLIMAKELKRLRSDLVRLDRFIRSHVSRLLKSDLLAVLAEFQRQDQVFLCMKLYDVVRKEIWYRPDMFFYRDMLMMLARNKKVGEAKLVWEDLKREEVLFDQHTFGDIIRAFLDSELASEAMDIYDEMRKSPDPPISLPFRVILKGLVPYPELREKVKDDFLELFPDMIVYDPPEDLFENEEWKRESEDD